MKLRTAARSLGLGRAAYWFVHAPAAALRQSAAQGGPLEQFRDSRAHAEMRRAAGRLAPQPGAPVKEWPEIYILTGRKFWDQAAFCLHTFQGQAQRIARVVFIDDGSADDRVRSRLSGIFPHARWCSAAEIEADLDRSLPADRFPFLRERRANYPNLRKLTDAHAIGVDWKLVLDSDMLFFRPPDFLARWLDSPDRPLHMTDVCESYGYSRRLMESLAGAPIPALVNVGLCGFRSSEIDWERLEYWCRRLIESEGFSYYLEQALVALLSAGRSCAVAPAGDYRVLPDARECRSPSAVMHHYVASSKRGYFRYAWRAALARREPAG